MVLTIMQATLLFLLSFCCLMILVNRICLCFERCSTAKAFGKLSSANTGMTFNKDDFEKILEASNKSKER